MQTIVCIPAITLLKKHFTDYIDQQLARIELPNKDIPFLREKMLLMYANPLTNYLATRTDNPK